MNVLEAIRKVCLSLPEAMEVESRGSPNFRVRGKTFAILTLNQHGDGRVALWLEALPGAQALYTETDPQAYFVPPYVGPKGWLGMELDKGLAWTTIVTRVREAYEKVAPEELRGRMGAPIRIREPVSKLKPEAIDPLQSRRSRAFLQRLDKLCATLPETARTRQFGNPVWKAGKKTFACVHHYSGLCLQVWVGVAQQGLLTSDPRYRIPPYVGHNGWIDLDVSETIDWREVEALVLASYRHFALQRMLQALDSVV